MKPDTKAIRARAEAEFRIHPPGLVPMRLFDVPALCDRVEALETALGWALLQIDPLDKSTAHDRARRVLEGEP